MRSPDEAMAIAAARIAEEAERRTGTLDLSGLGLAYLPESLFRLRHLRELDLESPAPWNRRDNAPINRIDAQRDRLGELAGLVILSVGWSDLKSLDFLRNIPGLQSLNCSGTQVEDLTPLAGLPALQSLDCSHTQVEDLTPLAGLTVLWSLDCSDTQVDDLTPLAGLTALQSLYCYGTQIEDLTPLAGLTALQSLYCFNTKVEDLTPLAGLTALQSLSCVNTKVEDLTPLAGLPALQSLDCSSCRLQAIPAGIRNKPSLTHLILYESHVPGLLPEVLSRSMGDDCLPRLRAHFADLALEAAEVTDVRLLLLGNGGVGKTQIARWLCGEDFETDSNSTHGIRVISAPLPDSPAAVLHLQIWDFGGQDIYHGTHALFLRGPAVLMPVWARDKEECPTTALDGFTFRNHPLGYWLDLVRHQGDPGSPVLIAQSKCDRPEQEALPFPVAAETLQALAYRKQLHVSPQAGRGRGALFDALQDAIAWLRDPARLGRPLIGAGRLRVQRRLEALREADLALPPAKRRHRWLDRSAFDAICAEEGGITSPDFLLDYLDANGTILYRDNLLGRIVLDPSWALDAIYAVFDRTQVYRELCRQHGRFTRSLLGLLVWRDQSEAEQDLLLGMMQSCGICFRHRGFGAVDNAKAEYIAPDLLPARTAITGALAARWDEDMPGESFSFRHSFLHGGLIRSILAAVGTIAGDDALYWRGGLCLYEAETGSRLRIEEEMTGPWQGMIHVRTQRGQAAALLRKIMPVIEQVQHRLGLRPDNPPPPRAEEPGTIVPGQEKPPMPEWYVSYAWGDDKTPEGRKREAIVDRLCTAAAARGHQILRDKQVLSLGDSISAFMRRIGTGDRVFVILSDKYLSSPHCMFELSEIWRTSRLEGAAFLERVRIYALPDTRIWQPIEWADWAIHWKQEYDQLNDRARAHGATILGEAGQRRLMLMQRFYTQVTDILDALADTVQPRTFEELARYGFDDTVP